MKKTFIALIIALLAVNPLAAQETPAIEEIRAQPAAEKPSVVLPVNLYDTFQWNEKYHYGIRAWMYAFGPGFVAALGILEWNWFDKNAYNYNPSRVCGADALNGMADKMGHLYATYTVKRLSTFLYRATGSSPFRANVEGTVYASALQFLMEVGDGFSSAQGFDIYDVVFNQIGAGVGFVLDAVPALDRMFALQWEYIPTRRMRKNLSNLDSTGDPFTDYSGMKFLFVTKLGGVPYLSRTPLRYVNLDFGYYARGYYNKYYDYSTRNLYAGISVNYSIVFGDILPTGYTSSTLQSFFNYIHPPFDLEVKEWELSKVPRE
ncbi:MAG TPA: DUF2279 domain-containing protein [Spirochaetes bacterium]|mgnify:CR=1 FL=1|nr:DUF2279 domain-containing protein [Spirochaetota bacterium]